eukprot:CAMPEP_0202728510 /NCGR_PEP_ID=MMETSP1385-20130828/185662_1 /ASSEMBLY_ACC=CAM_ASM_000861 /TAXON_ID=933848 /ORGANISM="Elphidium margaritaceum" /LENGTH=545 /DNA_ID=CAMNT_0049394759 /DNA_START=118 /DNA_END=1755 /DNA_ORIENTATION=-
MKWIKEEKGEEYELVYVVDIDQSKPNYTNSPNAVIATLDETYRRISIDELRSTAQTDMSVETKLRKALLFAAERSANALPKRGSILTEVYDEVHQVTTVGFMCFKTTETRSRKAVKGFEVCSYEWDQKDGAKFNGFRTRSIGAPDPASERQYKTIKNFATVINARDPDGRKLREKESQIEANLRIVEKQKDEIKALTQRVQAANQALQQSGEKAEKQRRNSIQAIDSLHSNMEREKAVSKQKQKEFSMDIARLQSAYDQLQQQYSANVEELRSVTEHRNALQDRLLEYDPDVQSLDDDFPAFQDIVTKFDDTRSQSRTNCAKYIKKYFKSQNKDWHKLNISKKCNVLLFEVLISIYTKMQSYLDQIDAELKAKYQTMQDENLKRVCYKELKQNFRDLFDSVKLAYVEAILNEIVSRYENIVDFCKKELFVQYIEDCLYCCWFIVVCQSPTLKLEPTACEYARSARRGGDDDDNKETAPDEISFDNEKYVAAFGSEDDECLNYYMWPCITRTDTNFQLSKIHALFLNELPLFSKKAARSAAAKQIT